MPIHTHTRLTLPPAPHPHPRQVVTCVCPEVPKKKVIVVVPKEEVEKKVVKVVPEEKKVVVAKPRKEMAKGECRGVGALSPECFVWGFAHVLK